MAQKRVIITQSNYIPWKGYFDNINQVDVFVIYDDMQYTKRDWRNRNKVKTEHGLKWLSIPVEVKGKYHQKINETLVADPKWGANHWNTMRHAYRNAPCFAEVKDHFEELFLNPVSDNLSHINQSLIERVNSYLGIEVEMRRSEEFELEEGKTERMVGICEQLGATDYYTGPAAQGYMEEECFTQRGVNVHYFDYAGYPEYEQVHGDFEHGVTILDLLFHMGKRAPEFMKSFAATKSA